MPAIPAAATDQEGAGHAHVLLAGGLVDKLSGVLGPELVRGGDPGDHQVLVQLQQRRVLPQQPDGHSAVLGSSWINPLAVWLMGYMGANCVMSVVLKFLRC